MKKMNKIMVFILTMMLTVILVPANLAHVEAATIKPTLKKASATIEVGKTTRIKVQNADDAEITYKSANKKIATVSKTGKVKGIAAGSTKIKVTVSKSGKDTILKFKVKVTKSSQPGSFFNRGNLISIKKNSKGQYVATWRYLDVYRDLYIPVEDYDADTICKKYLNDEWSTWKCVTGPKDGLYFVSSSCSSYREAELYGYSAFWVTKVHETDGYIRVYFASFDATDQFDPYSRWEKTEKNFKTVFAKDAKVNLYGKTVKFSEFYKNRQKYVTDDEYKSLADFTFEGDPDSTLDNLRVSAIVG